jgi:hypothetical protein
MENSICVFNLYYSPSSPCPVRFQDVSVLSCFKWNEYGVLPYSTAIHHFLRKKGLW